MAERAFHEVDPDGDCDLIVYYPEPEAQSLDDKFSQHPNPAGLKYRRPDDPRVLKISEVGDPRGLRSKKIKKIKEKSRSVVYSVTPPMNLDHEEARDLNRALEASLVDAQPSSTPGTDPTVGQITNTDGPGSAVEKLIDDEASSASADLREYIRIRISSKHLKLACTTFERMLKINMSEKKALESQDRPRFPFEGHDPEAVLLVMNIIHLRNLALPRNVDLEMLTKLAILVDYLGCYQATKEFTDSRMQPLYFRPGIYSSYYLKWMVISIVFRESDVFERTAHVAIKQGRSQFETYDLPIRDSITSEIDSMRERALDELFSGLEAFLDKLKKDPVICTFECDAMRYGALTIELSNRDLLPGSHSKPYLGYSFESVAKSLRNIEDPYWFQNQQDAERHSCSIKSEISSIVETAEKTFSRFSLSRFVTS